MERGAARSPRRRYAGPGYAARAAQVRLELAIERRCWPREVPADDVAARLAGLNPVELLALSQLLQRAEGRADEP